MYNYLFGPVPSRRLGMSLGVDLVPLKVCSLNCIYCECGRTTELTIQRKEYIPFKKVIGELKHFMANNPKPDYITFSGSVEPTLSTRIGDVIDYSKSSFPEIKVAVLTNGTLLWDPEVRKALLKADIVLPSLDAASDLVFRKINRPFKTLNAKKHIDGLCAFREEFSGKIWLEVFIVPGYNNSDKELILLKKAIEKIGPDLIQLNTLDRPGARERIRTAEMKELQRIVDFWGIEKVEIIKKVSRKKTKKAYRQDVETAILETIRRRQCTLEDLEQILGLHRNEINKYLAQMESEALLETVLLERGGFFQIKE